MKAKLYGVTHSPTDGSAIVRVPRVVKIQIGIPKGPDIQTAVTKSGSWLVWCNTSDKDNNGPHKVYEGPERKAAEWWYDRALLKGTMKPAAKVTDAKGAELKEIPIPGGKGVLQRRFPGKLAYFTFSRMNGDGTYSPDWDCIEAHGSYPTELDIVFTDDEALQASYQMWSKTELRCHGDGINAQRVLSLASTPEQKAAAEEAKAAGSKYFPIVGKCQTGGCPYAIAEEGKSAMCKPHGRLQLQLIKSIRLGGVAQFDTTSFRSISQLFSCLQQFLTFTGNGDPNRGFLAGIPLKMILRPFRVSPGGQVGTAYSVSLEFRADSVEALRSKILEAGAQFRQVMTVPEQAAAPVLRQIESTATPINTATPIDAAVMTAEFYDDDGAPEGGPPPSDSDRVKTATEERTSALAEKLRAQRTAATPAQMMDTPAAAAAATPEGEPIPVAEVMTAEEVSDWVDGMDTPPISDADDSPQAQTQLFAVPAAAETADPKKGGAKKR